MAPESLGEATTERAAALYAAESVTGELGEATSGLALLREAIDERREAIDERRESGDWMVRGVIIGNSNTAAAGQRCGLFRFVHCGSLSLQHCKLPSARLLACWLSTDFQTVEH